jgi:hypothetical protein
VDRGIEAPAISTTFISHVEVRFTDDMLTWEEFNSPTVQKLREQLDNFISRSKK